MGLFGIFGDPLEEKTSKALERIRPAHPEVSGLTASTDGHTVILEGTARNMEAKSRVMQEFSKLVGDANVINKIALEKNAAPPAPEPPTIVQGEPEDIPAPPEERIYEVQPGDTLGHIAQRFYGKASAYTKVFEANRDILDNPDLIKVGQKLRIPE